MIHKEHTEIKQNFEAPVMTTFDNCIGICQTAISRVYSPVVADIVAATMFHISGTTISVRIYADILDVRSLEEWRDLFLGTQVSYNSKDTLRWLTQTASTPRLFT